MVRTPSFDENGIKKGAWSPEEDRKLEAYIRRYGHWNWRELPKFAGLKRCGKSCRLRWMNYLRPNVRRGNYTNEEEELIMELHQKHGKKWAMIATKLPGRTDNEIKNHWHTHLKKRWRAQNVSSLDRSTSSVEISTDSESTQRHVSSRGACSSSTNQNMVNEDCFQNIQILESCPFDPQHSSATTISFSSDSSTSNLNNSTSGALFTSSSPADCFFPSQFEFSTLSDLFDPTVGYTNGEDHLFASSNSINDQLSIPTAETDGNLMDILEGTMDDDFWTKPFSIEDMSFYNDSNFNNDYFTSDNDHMLLSSFSYLQYDQFLQGLPFESCHDN